MISSEEEVLNWEDIDLTDEKKKEYDRGTKMKVDGHTHTHFCPHGSGEKTARFIERAIALGFDRYVLTEHAPLPSSFCEALPYEKELVQYFTMKETELDDYIKEMHALKQKYKDQIEIRIGFVKAFQELNNAYEALITYDDYNDEMEKSKALQEQVKTLETYIGVYNTVKGSLVEGGQVGPKPDFSAIEFYDENAIKVYDIDSSYIDRLLETYSANNQNIRDDIEKALQKLKKAQIVKDVYREILNAIDTKEIDSDEDILIVKRRFFTNACDQAVKEFSQTWFVEEKQLHLSAVQYEIGSDPIPNIGGIIDSKRFDLYKAVHPDAKPLKYGPEMKRRWRKTLDEVIVPLNDELR